MDLVKIDEFAKIRPADPALADLHVARCLAAAAAGDTNACYDLGVIFSTGGHGVSADLVEAHKWFNLAAAAGHEEAAWCRADVSEEMTAREIAEAQRRAREWLAAGQRRAAGNPLPLAGGAGGGLVCHPRTHPPPNPSRKREGD